MMEATDFANGHHRAGSRHLDGPHVRRILVEREMRSCAVIVRKVRSQDATQMQLVQNENMIQTLAPHRADQPLHERILPRTVRRRENFINTQVLHSVLELLAVDTVAIAEEVGRRGRVREGLHDLLGRPVRGGVLGHVEVDDAPAMVGEDDEDEEHPQPRGGHREEVDGDEVPDAVREERAPGLRRRGARFGISRDTVRSATLLTPA